VETQLTPRKKSDRPRVQKNMRIRSDLAKALEETSRRLELSQERIIEALIENFADSLTVEVRAKKEPKH